MHAYCIYLDWAGWKPEVWAAWAQALLSASAIYFAGRFAANQERRQKRERLDVIVQMLLLAFTRAKGAKERTTDAAGKQLQGDTAGFNNLHSSFKGISLHELPDYRMVAVVDEATAACSVLYWRFDRRLETSGFFDASDVEAIRRATYEIERSFLTAAKASNELGGFHLVARAKALWATLTRRERFKVIT